VFCLAKEVAGENAEAEAKARARVVAESFIVKRLDFLVQVGYVVFLLFSLQTKRAKRWWPGNTCWLVSGILAGWSNLESHQKMLDACQMQLMSFSSVLVLKTVRYFHTVTPRIRQKTTIRILGCCAFQNMGEGRFVSQHLGNSS
jgi:hypothetical protein